MYRIGGVIIFKRPLILMVISLILGVITGFYHWKYSLILFIGLVFLLTIVWTVGYYYSLFSVSIYQVIIIGICLCFFGVGVYRCRYVSKTYEIYDGVQYGVEEGQLEFQGQVTEIKKNTYGYSIVLKVEKGEVYVYADETLCGMLDGQIEYTVSEKQEMNDKKNQGEVRNIEDKVYESLYGENICVIGDIIPMKRARNFGNYDEYTALRSKGVLLKISAEAIVKLSDDKNNSLGSLTDGGDNQTLTIKGLIAKTKVHLRNVLQNIATEEEYGILAAMVLGENDEIDKEIKELYSISGISHIMAISGLHISLIGMGIYKLLRKKLRYISASSVSLGIMSFFLVFIGNPISATRAVIMFFVHIIADLYGRKYDVLSALSLAAVFLLIDNPFYLLNSSFQLSFAAMISVCVCVPIVTDFVFGEKEDKTSEELRSLSRKKEFKIKVWLKELVLKIVKLLVFNIVISIVLIPINSFLFFRHSTYSPVVNMIVVPLVGVVLVMTLLGMFTAIIIPGVGKFFIGTSIYLLRFFKWLSERIADLPYSSILIGKLSFFEVVLCYVIVAAVLIVMFRYRAKSAEYGKRNTKENCDKNKKDCVHLWYRKIRVYVLLGVLISVYLLMVFRNKYDGFSICYLDVGQGASIYIKSQTGNDYLIDGGSTDEKNIGEYKLESFLEARQVSKLEYVFVTHCDTDHISGIVELIERSNILIDKLVLPDISFDARDEKYLNLVMIAEQRGIDVMYMKAGDGLSDGELKLTCVNPVNIQSVVNVGDIDSSAIEEEKKTTIDINESSLVLYLEYKELAAVFTGDIGKETEQELISIFERLNLDKKLVVYDVAHHGSGNSNSAEFISIIKPRVAVVSCGKDNSYGHPAPEVIERLETVGSDVWYTYESGQVEVYEGKEGIMIKGYVAVEGR